MFSFVRSRGAGRRPGGRRASGGLALLLVVAACLAAGPGAFPPPGFAGDGAALPVSPRAYLPLLVAGRSGATDGRASWGAPIAVSPRDGSIWVVNPDAGSVSTFMPDAPSADVLRDIGTLGPTVTEIVTGGEPWSLVVGPDGADVYVVDRAGGRLLAIDTAGGQVRAEVAVGAEPGAVALSPSGATAYVTIGAAAEVAVVATNRLEIVDRVSVRPFPHALAVTDDGDAADRDERVYVTHFLAFQRPGGAEAADDGREGRVTVIDTSRSASATSSAGARRLAHPSHSVREITLAPDSHGFPNQLAAIALSGSRAWIPHIRAAPALPLGLTTTVFAAVASLDLAAGREDSDAHIPLNDEEIFGSPVNNPVAAVPSPTGERLYVVPAGSDLVEVVDVADPHRPRLVKFLAVGKNPRGMAVSGDGRWGYVMNYLSRTVSMLDLQRLEPAGQVVVTGETLAPEVLRGKRLFNNATDPRLTKGSWVSCASCHPDGATDGVTWIFPDGPRQTPPLWNAAQTLPWHWSAALDEGQDVEETIHLIQFGFGLAPGSDPAQLGAPNGGRSTDLDALAAFMERGIRVPAVAPPEGDLAAGRALFLSAGCAGCHGGPNWTISALPGAAGTLDPDGNGMIDGLLRAVGTHNPLDQRGATGFDVPALLGAGLTPPYLHDGSAPTIEALLAAGHPAPHEGGNGLDAGEVERLAAFVLSIGPATAPVGGASSTTKGPN